jgi:hypothetical protein
MLLGLRSPRPDNEWELVSVSIPRPGDGRIRVEVLNGAGVSGLARETTEFLRAGGFDVVYYGNASGQTRDSTIILDRGLDPDGVARVAAALGVNRVQLVPDTTLYLEATVILGTDFRAPVE